MNFGSFKEVAETASKKLADCPLGREAGGKTFDEPTGEFDKPLGDKPIKPDGDVDIPADFGKLEEVKTTKMDSDNDVGEVKEKKGGSYADVKKTSDGETHEVHHIPADSVNGLERNDGPAIKMEKEDHKQTASYGSSREAQEYRQKQKELIDAGKFDEAMQMDIDDIHEKFGDKYDDAIAEMKEYYEQLKEDGRV